jgi:tetratricopeptide (TPR) repeat protein
MPNNKKRFWVMTLVIAILGGIATFYVWNGFSFRGPDYSRLTEEEISGALAKHHGSSSTAQAAPERIAPERTIRVAIGHLGLSSEAKQGEVSDLALPQLTGSKGIEFVERQALDKVLRELQLSLGGLVRANDAVRAGKLVRADWFLLGSKVVLAGTNYVVVRMVDAHTGMLREAGVFQGDQSSATLAGELVAFTRQCRENAAEAKARTYLSVGGFEDLSVNNRLADLPQQVRTYLIAAYRGNPSITLLEREFGNVLLKEMQLDLAGLTDASATNQPAVMYSGYWMVDGSYQSYETTGFEVELRLNIHRMFGRHASFDMREKPGSPLFERIRSRIDETMQKDRAALTPTRLTEAQAQMSKGEELVTFNKGPAHDPLGGDFGLVYFSSTGMPESISNVARRRRNAQEAIRAFETVLLLDPGNRRASMYLAACFRQEEMGRNQDARDVYRQLIESPVKDRWTDLAQKGLLQTFQWASADEKRRWFETSAAATANPSSREFYQSHAKVAAEDATIQVGGSSKAEELAETRLFEYLESFNKGQRASSNLGMDDFVGVFGKDRSRAAQKLADLYPKMRTRYPDAAPHLLAIIVRFQLDTNAPIVAEFQRTLDWCIENPDKLPKNSATFWSQSRSVHDWAVEHGLTSLAVKMMEASFRVVARNPRLRSPFEDADKVALAFTYLALERWNDALIIFESFSNQAVSMDRRGPWGPTGSLVHPDKQAALCRQKLGSSLVADQREFDLGKPCVALEGASNSCGCPAVFLTDADGLWIGLSDWVMHLDFNLQTNFFTRLSSYTPAPVSALCIGDSNVWIGTFGGGLLELDKTTRKIRSYTEKDGLLLNHVSALHLVDNTLWIGYGNESVGGLGRLDVDTRRFTSFTGSLSRNPTGPQPPRQRVREIRSGAAGEVWYMAGNALYRSRPAENTWNVHGESVGCYVREADRLVLGLEIPFLKVFLQTRSVTNGVTNWSQQISRDMTYPELARLHAQLKTNNGQRVIGSGASSRPSYGDLELQVIRDGSRRRLLGDEGLPAPPTTLALESGKVWAGGQGYVALVDLNESKIKRLAHVPARSVDKIQIGGGWMWVLFDNQLYRAPLTRL